MTPLLTRAMCHSLLRVREQLLHPAEVLLRHHAGRTQLTLTLARLLGEDVTTMGLGSFESLGSLAKTLRRCPVGLQLGHYIYSACLAYVERKSPVQIGRAHV